MNPLWYILLVPVGGYLLLVLISSAFSLFNRFHDRAGIEEAEKAITAGGFRYQKCNVGSSWFVVHFQTPNGPAKARFRYNRKAGLSWENGTLERSISSKKKKKI